MCWWEFELNIHAYKLCNQSDSAEGKEASLLLNSESDCAVFALYERLFDFHSIAPLHLKLRLRKKYSLWPLKCLISYKIAKIIVDVFIVDFCKGRLSDGRGGGGGADC